MSTEDQGVSVGPTLDSLSDTTEDFVEVRLSPEEASKAPTETAETPEEQVTKETTETKPSKMGEEETSEETEEETSEETEEEASEVEVFDVEPFASEFFENGELSEDSRGKIDEKLKASGLAPEMADTYFEGLKAIQTLRGNELFEAAGSKEDFDKLCAWGTQNLPKEQQDAFNNATTAAILQGDNTAAKMLIAAVKAQMGGGEPNYVKTTNSTPDGIKPFMSQAEVTTAMRDPRYKRGERSYITEVQQRLAISDY